MKRIYSILILLFTISSFQTAFAEANYVYHEATTNNIGCGTNFRSVLTPTSAQALTVGFKVEFAAYWNQARIYYTTDGSTPSGSFGTGSGTTLVVTANYVCGFGSPVAETVTGVIPAQPAGTVVKYIVSAWHSGGGDEIFGNGAGAPCGGGCGTVTNSSSLATVFNYTVANVNNVEVGATAGTTIGSYATLSAAFTAINAGTHQGVINIKIFANTTEPADPTDLLRSASPSSYTSITIKPVGNRILNGSGTTGNTSVVDLLGADNVTIDGDDPNTAGVQNLSIVQPISTNRIKTCIKIASNSTTGTNGADNITIKNCIITGSRDSAIATQPNYGICITDGATMSTGSYKSINTIIENNIITRCWRGIYSNGASATYPNTGLIVRNNTLGSATSADNIGSRGIFLSYTAVSSGGALIENNDIRAGDYGATGYAANIAAIEVGTVNYGVSILRNNIHDVVQPEATGYGAYGILISGNTNNTTSTIANNFIRDIKMKAYQVSSISSWIPVAVYFTAGATGVNFVNNTVVMGAQLAAGNWSSYCVNASVSGVAFSKFVNNIIVNTHTSNEAYGIYCNATTNISGGNINNNDYYVPNTGNVGYYTAKRTTLADWQTATSKDGASISSNPPFVSATDLHINAVATDLESAGIATGTSGITVDYDSQTRPGPTGSVNGGATAPDLGADEFDGIPVAPIVITPASPAAVCSGTPVTLVASSATAYTYTWSPATGLNTTTGATVIATPTATTTYTVTGTMSGFTKTKTVTVTISPSPAAVDITNANASICADAIQTLTATGGSITGATATASSGTVNLAIPDGSLTTGVSQTLAVSGIPAGATITKVDVLLNITHTFDADLIINLEGPNGQIINLVNQAGSTGDNFTNTVVTSDTAATAFSAGTVPFTGTFKADLAAQGVVGTTPAVTSTTFSGLYTVPNGNWKVRVYDDASLDTGTLVNCSLTITYDVSVPITWSPTTNLYTDAACTTAYTGTNATTVYAKPSTTTTYTATATLGTCTVTDTVTLTVGTTTWSIVSPATTPSWDNGAPTSTVAAVISADYTTGGTSLDACSLTVNNNAVVVISSGDDVTLSSGSLTVASGSTYTQQNNANLIQTNASAVNSGGTIIERNSTPMNRLDYTMWCAPVSGTQTLQNYSQYTLSTRFYEYNTATDLYNSISNAGTWSMAKGYLIRVNNTWPVFPAAAVVWPGKFRGTPNNGTKTFTLSTAGNGFNAVGNPYPSALKVDDFINANSTQIDGTLWFWRKTNDTTNLTSYSTCTTAGCTLNNGHSYANADYLSVGQGFLVKAKAGATAVTFDNTMRASTNVDQFFKANNTVDRYWVSLNTSTGASFQNLYAYLPDATLNYDNGKDGIFYNDTTLASLSSVVNGVEMVIQARPSFVPTDVIPLMFKTTEAGTYSISLYQTEGVFADAQDILVKDNLLGTTQSIKLGAYTFTSDVGVFANRFELVYQPALSVNTANFDASVQVIKQNDDIVINAGNTIISKVKVFDTRGRLLIDKKNINASEVRLASDKTQQVLLVQITSNEGKVVTKKIVN